MTTRERMTAEQFAAAIASPANQGRRLELIDGELHEKPMPTEEHSFTAVELIFQFRLWFQGHPEQPGRVNVEARIRPSRAANHDVVPDVSVVLGVHPVTRTGPMTFTPQICIEIASPGDAARTLQEKSTFYLAHGARSVVIAWPAARALEVHTEEGVTTLGPAETLTFPALLPGFAVPVASLFPPPESITP